MYLKLGYFKARINEKTTDRAASPVVIVAFGDSVTQGFTTYGTIEPQTVYHNRLKIMLEEKYPLCTFSIINAGVGGQRAIDGLCRVERDVIKYDPDMVIVGFCLNDALGGMEKLGEYKDALENIVNQIRQKTAADIVLLTPNYMVTADNPNICEQQKSLLERFVKIQNEDVLASYVQVIRDIAVEKNVVLCDVYAEWEKLANNGIETNELLANGLNHPVAEMHKIPAELILSLF